MITNEMVEAACVAAYGSKYVADCKSKYPGIWEDKRGLIYRAIRAYEDERQSAEALRPNMVHVATLIGHYPPRADPVGFGTTELDGLPIGTKLYAEQPK
jgi:hypothetical protein